MKDLFLFCADEDTRCFLAQLLDRPKALGIRNISVHSDRHPQRDSGMVQTGPELLRMQKSEARRALMVFDLHGSGRERVGAKELAEDLQKRLNQATWAGNSAVLILEPELETWVWCVEGALAKHLGLGASELRVKMGQVADRLGLAIDDAVVTQPKELFEGVLRDQLRRTLSPRDFERLGKMASVKALTKDSAFARLLSQLRLWFPEKGAEHD